jgi:hypothetical protein
MVGVVSDRYHRSQEVINTMHCFTNHCVLSFFVFAAAMMFALWLDVCCWLRVFIIEHD